MKIVLANNYYYLRGGSERVLFDEERILRKVGHEVVPFSTRRAGNQTAKTEAYFVEACDFDRLSAIGKIRAVPRLIHNQSARRSFGALLEEHHPDIIHCHNIYGALTTSILLEAKRRGIPAIMTAHDAKLVCPSYLCLNHGDVCEACRGRRYFHCLLNRCHKNNVIASAVYTAESFINKWLKRYEILKCVITPSRFHKALFERNGFPSDWVTYLPNAVDAKAFVPNYQPGNYILYVGRLSREKGVISLIEAVKGTGIPLRIVGVGPARAEAERYAGSGKVADISFEGYRTGSELSALFQQCALMVLPSQCYENAPMSVLEAYAYGKPVVGSRIGGIPELIEAGSTGALVESGNIEGLRDTLVRAWDDRVGIEEQGRNARKLVEDQFSLRRHYAGLMAVYRRYGG